MFLKLAFTLLTVVPACAHGKAVSNRDSIETETMRSAIFIRSGRRGYAVYLDGRLATDSALEAAFVSFPEANLIYARYAKMMSHETSTDKIYLVGIGGAIMFLPLFSIPAVYKSDFCQGTEIALFAGWFGYGLGWHIIAKCKIVSAVRDYNRLLFLRAGLSTRHLHRRIKDYYYAKVFQLY